MIRDIGFPKLIDLDVRKSFITSIEGLERMRMPLLKRLSLGTQIIYQHRRQFYLQYQQQPQITQPSLEDFLYQYKQLLPQQTSPSAQTMQQTA